MGSSQVILVGTSRYDHQASLPAVVNNLTRLAELFSDPDIGGFDPGSVHVVREEQSPTEVLRRLYEATSAAQERLIVYFAGHGLTAPKDGSLYLALSRSSYSKLHEAIRYDDVREAVRSSPARAKVTILDCCFSGQAMEGFMGSADIAARTEIADTVGTYLLTATAETQLALAPEGAEFTAFTAEIVNTLTEGVSQEIETINMDLLYFAIRDGLAAKGFPIPQNRARNDGRSIMFARNPRRSKTDAPQAPAVPETSYADLPADYESAADDSPDEVMALVLELRATGEGTVADQLLEALGARWPDQELASLIALADDDATAILLRSAAGRRPEDVTAFLEAAEEVLPDDGLARALSAVAAEGPEQVAAILARLRSTGASGLAGRVAESARQNRRTTAGIIALVAALWAAGLELDIDHLLDAAASELTATETIELADALLGAGREDEARRYYLTVLDEVAQLPPGRIVTVVQAFADGGDGQRLVKAAAGARRSLSEAQELANSLRTGVDEAAAAVALAAAIEVLGSESGLELIKAEWKEQRRDTALALARQLALINEHEALAAVVSLLRGLGRPIDANRLLRSLAGSNQFASALASLVNVGAEEESRRLFAYYVEKSPDSNKLIPALIQNSGETRRVLTAMVLNEAPDLFLDVFRQLRNARTTRGTADMLLASAVASPDVAAFTLRLLVENGLEDEVGRMLFDATEAPHDYPPLMTLIEAASASERALAAAVSYFEEILPAKIYDPNELAAHFLVAFSKADASTLCAPALKRLLGRAAARLVDLLNQLVVIDAADLAAVIIGELVEEEPRHRVADLLVAMKERGAPGLLDQAFQAVALRPDAATFAERAPSRKSSRFRKG